MKGLFLACALALPIGAMHHADPGGYDSPYTRDSFLEEYRQLKNILEFMYPYHEFLIIPAILHHQHPGQGWIRIPLEWNEHIIYKRPRDWLKVPQTHTKTTDQAQLSLAA